MKREVRTKPVDVWRHLQVVSSLEEARGQGDRRSLDDDDGLERGGSSASAFAQAGGGGDKGSNSGLTSALERAKSLTLVASAKAKEIPTPQIEKVPDYEALVDKSYKLPDSYIRTKKLPQILAPGVEPEGLEYNLEMEDEEWLKGHKIIGPKGELAGALDEDRMERMIDELEKATGAGEAISLTDAESVLEQRMGMQPIGSNKTVIAEVWGYWAGKRQRFKKPLLRRFWPVTSINDTNPHLVFRPREKERYKLRKHRKNDGEAYRRLELLRRDFKQVQDLLALVRKREQTKLALLKLQTEEFLQSIAELCGQPRKPQIPKEAPTAVRDELKLKIRLPSMAAGGGDERRKKRQREELESAAARAGEQALLNPEQERMRRPVAWGFKEKEGALATPDYLPSFMEEFRLRQAGRAPPRRPVPYADEAELTYGWKTFLGGGGGVKRGGGRGGSSMMGRRGAMVGHVRSGVVTSGPGRRLPPAIEYGGGDNGEDTAAAAPATVRYSCRARLARGGRIVFDRVPLASHHAPPARFPEAAAPEQEQPPPAAAEQQQEDVMPPPPGQHLQHPHASAYHPPPADAITVALSAAPTLGAQLERYPTCDLTNPSDVFKYPTKFFEVVKLDDGEDEVVEPDPFAPSDPDPLLVLPSRPRPPETDAVALLRFQLRL